MKNKVFRNLVTVILTALLLISIQVPAYAESATVNVRFIVKNQQGAYSHVSIQFGQNTKVTNRRGQAEFKLKDIPVTTMVNAFLVDPNVPAGYNCDINFALGAHEDVQVNSTNPGNCSLSIMFTENTKTIVIEYFVGHNTSYGYSSTEFEHKAFSSSKPKAQQNPVQPQPNNDPNAGHPDGYDPDMPPEEPRFEEHNGEGFYDMSPENEYYGEPFILWTIPGYAWVIIIIGTLLTIAAIVLISITAKNKKAANKSLPL